jgi:hypothetical protein
MPTTSFLITTKTTEPLITTQTIEFFKTTTKKAVETTLDLQNMRLATDITNSENQITVLDQNYNSTPLIVGIMVVCIVLMLGVILFIRSNRTKIESSRRDESSYGRITILPGLDTRSSSQLVRNTSIISIGECTGSSTQYSIENGPNYAVEVVKDIEFTIDDNAAYSEASISETIEYLSSIETHSSSTISHASKQSLTTNDLENHRVSTGISLKSIIKSLNPLTETSSDTANQRALLTMRNLGNEINSSNLDKSNPKKSDLRREEEQGEEEKIIDLINQL